MKLRQHAGLAKVLALTQRYPALVLLAAMAVGGLLAYLFLAPEVTPVPRHARQQTLPPQQGIPGLQLEKAQADSDVLKLSRTNEELKKQVAQTSEALAKVTTAQQAAERSAREREAKQHEMVEAVLQRAQRENQQAMQQAVQKAVQDAATPARQTAAHAPAKPESPKPPPATLIRQVPEMPRVAPTTGEGQGQQRRLMRSVNPQSLAGSPPPLNRVETPYLSIGSFAPIRVVTGVAATSRENGALPVLLSVVGPFHPPYQLQGPGRDSTPTAIAMHGCFLMGKAQANMASGRADIELQWLSCVMPNLMAYEREIRGYVTGVDLRFGMPGYVESQESAILAKVFLTSLLAGAAEAFKLARQTTVVTPFGGSINYTTGNYGEVAGFSALANASAQLSAYYLQQASRLMPTIIVDAGAPGAAVLQEPLLLEDFPTRMLVAAR